MEKNRRAPWTALVLSGGGARGAYEAGVIKYLRDELPPRIRAHMRFEVICGTSVGAINCCFIAAHNHIPDIQGKALVHLWQQLRIENVYKIGLRELLTIPRFIFGSRGRGELDDGVAPGRLGGLFNTSPLEQLVREGMRWENLSMNLASGDLQAIAITATHIASGKTHVFVQQAKGGLPLWSTDPQVEAFEVTIAPTHALASAALPWIFPAVEIDGQIYCDGAVKLNTPISPAIRLGADRMLVIGVRSNTPEAANKQFKMSKIDHYPSAFFLLGKILNALMLDKTEYDLKRLQRFNTLIETGKKTFGNQFEQALSEALVDERGSPYRSIETLMIRPSEDISEIASRHMRADRISSRAGGLVGPFLRRISEVSEGQANDLLSYLLFDGEFAKDLINLGMQDADKQRQQIIDFFAA